MKLEENMAKRLVQILLCPQCGASLAHFLGLGAVVQCTYCDSILSFSEGGIVGTGLSEFWTDKEDTFWKSENGLRYPVGVIYSGHWNLALIPANNETLNATAD